MNIINKALLAVVGACLVSACGQAVDTSDGSSSPDQNQGQSTGPAPAPSPSPAPAPAPLPAPAPNPAPAPAPAPAPRPSSAANIKVCPPSTLQEGVDVSDYDPGTNWTNVKTVRNFTFIKATEGLTYISPVFKGDWANSKTAGMIRGAYHFFHANDDANTQAQNFLRTVGTIGAGDLPPVLDWEVSDGQSVATQIARAQQWLDIVEAATGRTPIIYVSPGFYNELGNPKQFARYPLWIANYDVACPSVPPPWSKWTFWQVGIGKATGVIAGDADLDVFGGSLSQLVQFVMTGGF